MEWVARTLHTTSEHGVSSITTITTAGTHTSAARSRINCSPPPTDLNGLVRSAEGPNLVSAHVPLHFKRSLLCSKSPVFFIVNFNVRNNNPASEDDLK